MPRERFLTLEEAVEMVLANDSAEVTDVVLLPPPSADDILTDEEEGDSDIAIVNTLPNDVAGEVEVHTADADECEADMHEQAPQRPKKPCKDPRAWKRTTQYSGAIVQTEFQPLQVTHSELVDEEPFDLFARLLNKEIIAWRLYTEVGSEPPLDQLQFTRLIVQGLLTKRLDTRERPGPSGALVFHSKEGHGHHLVPLGKQSS
ncbi:hypothetical protein HPB52_015926 [Rhipicephalus sanguineus]|uniref:PiggyBac transposable element-derived protein domain-containing protein n=1 Tax=Rhipicephalus sanguineus TaxID=34632 RepID=A0A9D4Q6Z3_RHISA|nr:hypothetical protein HPB52_015926 [Rhipicephalus sanguineus]